MSRLPLVRFQAIDGNGDPLPGAKLYFYVTGTDTPLDTYSDAGMTTPNANPVIADADGRFGDIWLGADDYKVVLRTASDTLVWTADPVRDAATFSEFANTSDTAKGDALIGVKRTFDGATPTTLHAWIDRAPIDPVTDGGCLGDGSTDDGPALNALLAAVPDGAVIDGRGRTYKVGSSVTLRSNIEIRRATFDFSAAAVADTLFEGTGTYGTEYTIASGATVDGFTLTLSTSDAANFAFKDIVRIKSDDVFDASNTNTKLGEINFVQTVDTSTGVVTLRLPLQGTYSTSPKIQKLTLLENIRFRDCWFKGKAENENDQIGIRVIAGRNIVVENCRFDEFDSMAVALQDVIWSRVEGNTFYLARDSGTAYGVSFIDATQDCVAYGNHFVDVRHSLSTNNSVTPGGVPRRIVFEANTVTISAAALGGGGGDAIDSHGAAEDISILNNTVIGATGSGINVECASALIAGNTIISPAAQGITVRNESDQDGEIVVANNRVEKAGSRGIYIFQGSRGTSAVYRAVTISGNSVVSPTSDGIYVATPTTTQHNCGVSITGNTIRSAAGYGIAVENVRQGTIQGNTVRDAASGGIRVIDSIGVAVAGNAVGLASGSSAHAIVATATAAGLTTDCVISANSATSSSGSITGSGVRLDNNVQYTAVLGNNVRNTAGINVGTGTGNTSANNLT